jgi:acyl dehydratase
MSDPEIETLVTDQMRAAQGVWTDEVRSFPVRDTEIRRWAIATYWPERPPQIYWDEEYAKQTRWGGIIAPPDFNPFAWPIDRPDVGSRGALPGQKPKKGENILNGGQRDTFFQPVRPGDVITSRQRLSHWEERQGRLGLTIFEYTEVEWRNQDGALVKRRIRTRIRY